MNTLRLYIKSIGMLLKSHLQYPSSFIMQTLAQLVMEGGEMMVVILIVDRFESLKGWSGGNLYFFLGIMSVSFYLTELFGRGITGDFPSMVRTGRISSIFLPAALSFARRSSSSAAGYPIESLIMNLSS